MLTRKQKEEIVKDLSDKINRQQSLVFTDISGSSVGEVQELRRELKRKGAEYKVLKKSLITLALKKENKNLDISDFTGSVAVAFGYEDPITPIKALDNFSKKNENIKILGGMIDGKVLTISDIKTLASIPSRQELLANLIYSIKGPIYSLTNVLNGNIRNLLLIFKTISES